MHLDGDILSQIVILRCVDGRHVCTREGLSYISGLYRSMSADIPYDGTLEEIDCPFPIKQVQCILSAFSVHDTDFGDVAFMEAFRSVSELLSLFDFLQLPDHERDAFHCEHRMWWIADRFMEEIHETIQRRFKSGIILCPFVYWHQRIITEHTRSNMLRYDETPVTEATDVHLSVLTNTTYPRLRICVGSRTLIIGTDQLNSNFWPALMLSFKHEITHDFIASTHGVDLAFDRVKDVFVLEIEPSNDTGTTALYMRLPLRKYREVFLDAFIAVLDDWRIRSPSQFLAHERYFGPLY